MADDTRVVTIYFTDGKQAVYRLAASELGKRGTDFANFVDGRRSAGGPKVRSGRYGAESPGRNNAWHPTLLVLDFEQVRNIG
jgi:hypothetical protein